jgi:hypothetical protein
VCAPWSAKQAKGFFISERGRQMEKKRGKKLVPLLLPLYYVVIHSDGVRLGLAYYLPDLLQGLDCPRSFTVSLFLGFFRQQTDGSPNGFGLQG